MRKKWDGSRRKWCTNGILGNHRIPSGNSRSMWNHYGMGHLKRNGGARTNRLCV
jgi:hypothetical protein